MTKRKNYKVTFVKMKKNSEDISQLKVVRKSLITNQRSVN